MSVTNHNDLEAAKAAVQQMTRTRRAWDTWYDRRGMTISFPNSNGFPGIGLTCAEWDPIKNAQPGDHLPDYAQQYIAPFDRCKREADMTQAYLEFQRRMELT